MFLNISITSTAQAKKNNLTSNKITSNNKNTHNQKYQYVEIGIQLANNDLGNYFDNLTYQFNSSFNLSQNTNIIFNYGSLVNDTISATIYTIGANYIHKLTKLSDIILETDIEIEQKTDTSANNTYFDIDGNKIYGIKETTMQNYIGKIILNSQIRKTMFSEIGLAYGSKSNMTISASLITNYSKNLSSKFTYSQNNNESLIFAGFRVNVPKFKLGW